MRKPQYGFTIVELLIVIVVIAILAAISIVAYNGIQQRAENTKTIQGVSQTLKLLEMYKTINNDYPNYGAALVCIGEGYVGGVCHTGADGTTPQASVNPAFDTDLRTVGSLPTFSMKPLTQSNGQVMTGASWQYSVKMIRYYLSGSLQDCAAGGSQFNFGSVTACRITLP